MNMAIKITQCPTCGSDKIQKICENCTREFRGKKYTVPDLEYYCCPDCGEKLFDREAIRKIEAYSPAYAKRHNDQSDWHEFIRETYGCLADDPIERCEQGKMN